MKNGRQVLQQLLGKHILPSYHSFYLSVKESISLSSHTTDTLTKFLSETFHSLGKLPPHCICYVQWCYHLDIDFDIA